MQKLYKSKYFLICAGVLCGFINGLLGAGGGILFFLWNKKKNKKEEKNNEENHLSADDSADL